MIEVVSYAPVGTKPALKAFLSRTFKVGAAGYTLPQAFNTGLKRGASLWAAYLVSGKVKEWTGCDHQHPGPVR
ncbi:MAG: hypothetical protein H7338_09075 [Candidatus Sericytochromatia bacterium]|nr:hypothetical protein [Candidatus Sericytochromatia bacterium]